MMVIIGRHTTLQGHSYDEAGQWRPFLREGPEAKSCYREMSLHVLSQKGGYKISPEYGSEI